MNYAALIVVTASVLWSGAPAFAKVDMHMREQLIEWARSSETADHRRVREALMDRATLQTLDKGFAPTGRRGGARQPTPYDEILGALASNSAPSAREAFELLASDAKFAKVAADSPLDPLSSVVRASASLQEPDRRIVDFWRKLSVPDAGYAPLVFEALLVNGSPQAIELSVELAGSKNHPAPDRIAWIRDSLTPRRMNETALAAAERLLHSSSVPKQVKTTVVEALFARDVSKWFTPGTWPGTPPDAASASSAARAARNRIARSVLASGLTLPRTLRADVEAATGRP